MVRNQVKRNVLMSLGKIQHRHRLGSPLGPILGRKAEGFILQNIVWALQKHHLLENTSLFNLEAQIQTSETNACCKRR